MTQLSLQRFAAARNFLATRARPLEWASFCREFEQGAPGAVLAALAQFQNPDGGFGNALEPDFRLPDSSALATSVGLQHLERLGSAEASVVMRSAVHYLAHTYDEERQGWLPVPPTVADFPRAPWWEPEAAEDSANRWVNPSAELIAYLYEVPGVMPDSVRDKLTGKAFAWLEAQAGVLEMHDLLCYLRLAERLPRSLQDALYEQLDRHVQAVVVTDPAAWSSYCLQPLQVVHGPDSRYFGMLESAVEANLEDILEGQGDDGAWEPTWAWGRFEEIWATARVEWKGILTLESLRILQAFGRIAS
ncbi:MAG: hypothetical protein ACYCO4_00195 [Sulfobacillus sp.]